MTIGLPIWKLLLREKIVVMLGPKAYELIIQPKGQSARNAK